MLSWQGKIQMERLTEIYLQVYGSKKKNRLGMNKTQLF